MRGAQGYKERQDGGIGDRRGGVRGGGECIKSGPKQDVKYSGRDNFESPGKRQGTPSL